MKLPETDNAHHHYAFKKGYRLALEGKPQSHMPSQIRQDREMRNYFQMGWEQLQEELKNGEEAQQRTPWRQRFAWYLMVVLAGIGTASLMISQKQEAQLQQQQKIDLAQTSVKKPTEAPTENASQKQPGLVVSDTEITADSLRLTLDEPNSRTQSKTDTASVVSKPQQAATPQKALSLLTEQQRLDLEQTRTEQQQKKIAMQVELSPVVSSQIQINRAQLGQSIKDRHIVAPLDTVVPKYIRQVAFFTEVENAKNQTIYHRWVYQDQVMATVALNIDSAKYRTWSTKQLTSAWEGAWHIDVLDNHKNVIFRHHFRYIQ